MDNTAGEEITKMENRTYIIGREGHIYVNDPTVSKRHAEIQILNGEVYLRDLGSTNGTFLIKNQRLVRFVEGYVQFHQMIVLGNKQYSIKDLLKIAGAFAA
jgi:pSer/pThr/pTyr-binding forkhead associated (FHA) protein